MVLVLGVVALPGAVVAWVLGPRAGRAPRGRDPADALHRADDALVEAHRHLGPLHDQLTTAHNQLGHLGRLITED